MTTEEAIAAIKAILEEHCPGTYDSGQKMADFLRREAEAIEESIADDMSLPHD
jgi:hypothetical protein